MVHPLFKTSQGKFLSVVMLLGFLISFIARPEVYTALVFIQVYLSSLLFLYVVLYHRFFLAWLVAVTPAFTVMIMLLNRFSV